MRAVEMLLYVTIHMTGNMTLYNEVRALQTVVCRQCDKRRAAG